MDLYLVMEDLAHKEVGNGVFCPWVCVCVLSGKKKEGTSSTHRFATRTPPNLLPAQVRYIQLVGLIL